MLPPLPTTALNLVYVAAGRLDGFWEMGLKPWDIAAGVLLIQEAGGMVGGFDGTPGMPEIGDILAGGEKSIGRWLRSSNRCLQLNNCDPCRKRKGAEAPFHLEPGSPLPAFAGTSFAGTTIDYGMSSTFFSSLTLTIRSFLLTPKTRAMALAT
jgi:hypothetical protein